ncbi:MAG: LamG domain-containing protein [Bacteroidales bacterium]|nr:LamG domain-containing protein [Bacteroidales bacterium]MCF8402428.1 LamG domain-containing protein [Bacteroidales bacterium]
MKKLVFLIAGAILFALNASAQVVVTDDESYTTGESSSVLDIQSDSKGLLLPRINGHNISNPVNGLLVFDTVTDSYWYFKNDDWFELLSGGTSANRMMISDSGWIQFIGEATAWEDLTVSVNSTTEGGSNPPRFAQFAHDGGSVPGAAKALNFMGSSKASISDNGLYSLNLDHSIEFWIKPNNETDKNKKIIEKDGVFYLEFRKHGKLAIKYDGIGWQESEEELDDGAWNYVVITMDDLGSEKLINLYINNEEALTISDDDNISTNTNDIEFNTNNTHFGLDNVAIWGKVLSETEIADGYNEGAGRSLTGSETDLNGFWELDESSGSTFSDETSNNNTGSISGTENSTFEWTDGLVGSSVTASVGVYTYWFDSENEEELYFSVQLPHSWLQGSDILPHVHWVGDENGGSGEDVCWGLEYTWSNIGTVFPNTTTIYSDTTIFNEPIVKAKHYLTKLPTISGSGKTLSSMIQCRVFRDASGKGGTDAYTGKAGLLEIDFHYQVDALGSDEEFIK